MDVCKFASNGKYNFFYKYQYESIVCNLVDISIWKNDEKKYVLTIGWPYMSLAIMKGKMS